MKDKARTYKHAVTVDNCHVFGSYEITWLKGPRGWQSGKPVHIMMSQLQSGAGK